ncbi:hypothetical protein [Anaerostipes faecalis]|uniref:hypothetical protein n=1 Tax=Anaerostipes faecalis TaxID=2738446 RepID=UPI003F0D1DDA
MNSKMEKIIIIYWIFASLMLASLYQYASGISIRFFGMLACIFCIYLLLTYHLWKQPIVFGMIGFMIWIGISGWANGGITNLISTCVSKNTSLWFILFFAAITMMLVERINIFLHLILNFQYF